jgi:hypothetical protein
MKHTSRAPSYELLAARKGYGGDHPQQFIVGAGSMGHEAGIRSQEYQKQGREQHRVEARPTVLFKHDHCKDHMQELEKMEFDFSPQRGKGRRA